MVGLINMNGRMYDPLLGRMLSSDNYVQSPDYTQSYNRYSYAWNNPIRYSDPDGNFIVAAAAVGAIINIYMQSRNGNITSSKDFWTAALVGGAAGAAGSGVGGLVPRGIGFTSAAISNGLGGFTGGLVGVAGNAMAFGGNIAESAIKGGFYGAVSGAFIGGMVSGFRSVSHGGDFWTGDGATYHSSNSGGKGYLKDIIEDECFDPEMKSAYVKEVARGKIEKFLKATFTSEDINGITQHSSKTRMFTVYFKLGFNEGTLLHEFSHANDYANGFYFAEAQKYGYQYADAMSEVRAYGISSSYYYNTGNYSRYAGEIILRASYHGYGHNLCFFLININSS
jgi:RHS repeat-associated protein